MPLAPPLIQGVRTTDVDILQLCGNTCLSCKSLFLPFRKGQKYCSNGCRELNRTKNNRELLSSKGLCLDCCKINDRLGIGPLCTTCLERAATVRNAIRNKLRVETFKAYGNKCQICGESNQEFLSIDHINFDGKEHRKLTHNGGGYNTYRWLRDNKYPQDDYRLLCFNCNCSRKGIKIVENKLEDFLKVPSRRPVEVWKRREKIKRIIREHYGNKCACCGENNPLYLTLDHIDGGGREHRKLDKTANDLWMWVYKKDFPNGYRLLCYNCNLSIGFFEYCPHSLNKGSIL